jgi:DNA-binding NarL/FixJ family response regulator
VLARLIVFDSVGAGAAEGATVAGPPIRVLVADESRAVRLLVTSLLREDARFAVVGDVETGADVLARAADADLVVLDLVLADTDAFALIQQLRSAGPQAAAVIFASVGPPYLRGQAAAQGAAGYFTHDTDPSVLLDELAAAAGGAERR